MTLADALEAVTAAGLRLVVAADGCLDFEGHGDVADDVLDTIVKHAAEIRARLAPPVPEGRMMTPAEEAAHFARLDADPAATRPLARWVRSVGGADALVDIMGGHADELLRRRPSLRHLYQADDDGPLRRWCAELGRAAFGTEENDADSTRSLAHGRVSGHEDPGNAERQDDGQGRLEV